MIVLRNFYWKYKKPIHGIGFFTIIDINLFIDINNASEKISHQNFSTPHQFHCGHFLIQEAYL